MKSDTETIATQAKIIFALTDQITELKSRLSEIRGELICCSGPLNDNILKFNKAQLGMCQRILDQADGLE